MRSAKVVAAIGALAVGIGAGVIPAAATAGKASSKPKIKTITVADDYFSLVKLTVKEGQEIKWVWSKQNFDSHNVTLVSGPKKVNHRKFTSATGVSGVKFERIFLAPGKYHFQCTIHPDSMNTILTVKK
jgi:plastocyanin